MPPPGGAYYEGESEIDKELKYFERVLVNALSSLNEACEEGCIPRDDAYVFSLTSIVDNLNSNSTVPIRKGRISW